MHFFALGLIARLLLICDLVWVMDTSIQSVLITGTSAGSIGAALAASFANEGLTVFATARDLSRIEPSLAARSNVHLLLLDVTSTDSIVAAVEAVSARTHGSLDYLVNNAGAGYTMPLADVDLEKAKQVFEVNLWGVMAMTKAFMPLLLKAKGTVVNISSVGAIVHTPWIGKFSLVLERPPTVVLVYVPGLQACGRHGRLSPRQQRQYCLFNEVIYG